MPRVRILPGLPACAPAAKHFGSTGPQHRDGLLVELVPDDAPSWVGSFQRGATCFDEAVFEPGTQRAVVIAGGLGYVVDPSTRACDRTFGGHIEQVWTP